MKQTFSTKKLFIWLLNVVFGEREVSGNVQKRCKIRMVLFLNKVFSLKRFENMKVVIALFCILINENVNCLKHNLNRLYILNGS